jgi:hypothetical protein
MLSITSTELTKDIHTAIAEQWIPAARGLWSLTVF